MSRKIRFMQGNEAVVEGAIAAGVQFFAGYPITPASEISEGMSIRLPQEGGTYLQMEDELGSMAAIVGASMGGMKSMTATSGPGFSLMQENLGLAAAMEIPCVVVDVMRVGPASGMATLPAQGDVMQARWGSHGDRPSIVLCPSTVKETFELTVAAVNISEQTRVPVVLLSDAVVGHLRERVELPEQEEVTVYNRRLTTLPPKEYKPFGATEDFVPDWANRGNGYRYHMCSNNHNEWGFPMDSNSEVAQQLYTRLDDKMKYWADKVQYYKTMQTEDAEIILIAYGCTARTARETVRIAREQGIKLGLLHLQTLWPFPDEIVRSVCGHADRIIVPEMNLGQVSREAERALHRPVEELHRVDGKVITPAQIMDVILSKKGGCQQ